MAGGGVKRKLADGNSMYLLFGSTRSPMAAALFELKLRNSGEGERDGDGIYVENTVLEQIQLFYNQSEEKQQMDYVAFVRLSDGNYFVLPNEIHRALSSNHEIKYFPYVFNPVTMTIVKTAKSPSRPKVNPFAAVVGSKVYVLSRRAMELYYSIPARPSFEAYDQANELWEALETPWFNVFPSRSERNYPEGFAVAGQFILVCLAYRDQGHSPICSYDTTLNEWQDVKASPLVYDDHGYDDDFYKEYFYKEYHNEQYLEEYRIWKGEAVFRDGFIYGIVSASRLLASFSSKMPSEEEPCLSIGLPVIVKDCTYPPWGRDVLQSCAVALMNDLLCVVHNASYGRKSNFQPVHISLLSILEPGVCSPLKDFTLKIPVHEQFDLANITSCLIFQPELDNSMDNKAGDGKKPTLHDSSCDASMVADVEML